VIPEGADREVLRERLLGLLSGLLLVENRMDAVLDAEDIGVFDPETHVPVERDLLRRMAHRLVACDLERVRVTDDWFGDAEWDLIEGWSE
jgi:hypothetical protein